MGGGAAMRTSRRVVWVQRRGEGVLLWKAGPLFGPRAALASANLARSSFPRLPISGKRTPIRQNLWPEASAVDDSDLQLHPSP